MNSLISQFFKSAREQNGIRRFSSIKINQLFPQEVDWHNVTLNLILNARGISYKIKYNLKNYSIVNNIGSNSNSRKKLCQM